MSLRFKWNTLIIYMREINIKKPLIYINNLRKNLNLKRK